MTTSAPLCPDCSARLDGGPTCASCGLRLTGSDAGRLWQIDQELAGLGARREVLLAERGPLLARLRPAGAAVGAPVGPVGAPTVVPGVAAPPRAEWTPHRVQNTLLGLGGLLLAVAAAVFAAVTYERLGAGGRALVLLTLTAVAAGAVPVALRRGLSATAETLTAVALALCALDAYGLRKLGVGGDADLRSYLAVTTAVLSATSLAYAAVVPVRTARVAAVVLAQLPLGFVLWRVEASDGVTALALAALAAADLSAVAVLRRGAFARTAAAGTLAVASGSLLAVSVGAAGEPGRCALALVVLAAVAAGGSALVSAVEARRVLAGLPVLLGAAAALVLAAPRLEQVQLPLVAAAVAVLAVQAAGLLPAGWRDGPVGGALLVGAGALAAVAVPVVEALVLPLGWLAEPWTLAPGSGVRTALSPDGPWTGTVVATVVVAAATVTAGSAGLVLRRPRPAAAVAGPLVVAAVALLPLGLATSYGVALAVLLVAATGLLAAGLSLQGPGVSVQQGVRAGLLGAATALALLAAVWSTADRTTTLVVLPLVTLLFAAAAALPARLPSLGAATATALAGVAGTATLAAAGAARGLAAEQVGPLLLAGPAVLLLVSAAPAVGRERRLDAEVTAAALCLPALALTADDAGWLSWTLALTGVLALVTALRPDRRAAAFAGALLLAASSWVRLADADVRAPEPYVVPLGLVVLALGHLRRRSQPTTSFAAYGPGLALLLVPSLLASFDDATLRRPLLLGLAAVAVLLVGARAQLRAPIVLGGAVLAVDGLQLLAPYAAALPRWLSLGAAGALLVAVGATYEQRLRELGRLRRTFSALG